MGIDLRDRRAVTPFGKELQKIREKRGILKSTMAKNLGVTLARITAYETGAKAMDGKTLQKIIRRYSLSIKDQIDLFYAYKISEEQEDLAKETMVVRVHTEAVDRGILKLLNKARGLDPSELPSFVKAVEELIYGRMESQAHRMEMFDTRLPLKIIEILKNEYGFALAVEAKKEDKRKKP